MKSRLIAISLVCLASSSFAQQAQKPAPPPPSAAAAAATPPPTAPLPPGAKVAYVNLQYIASNSADGKAANARVDALVKKKQAEAATKKTPQEQQAFQQQAMQEVQQMQAGLQEEFQKKLFPLLQKMAQEKHLSMLLSAQDAGLIWAEPGLDLTAEAMKRLDAVTGAAASVGTKR
jgi:Skp family chaperone for outer membrane proteins